MKPIASLQAAVKLNDAEHSSAKIASRVVNTGAIVPVAAELIGTNQAQATALGIEVRGNSPVLALCRRLVEHGHDPAAELHAYRGDVLALKVRSIGEGAKLTVKDNHIRKPIFRRWRDSAENGAGASPVRQTVSAKGSGTPSARTH
jgi:hypothetical protein